MNATTIINRANTQSALHSKDQLSRLAFNVGMLEGEVQILCRDLDQYKPVAEGVETIFKHAGCDLVVFYEADSEGDIDITGVFANGMDVTDLLMDTSVMDAVMEHVTDHAYIQRKQAEYDRAEKQWENKRDADLESWGI